MIKKYLNQPYPQLGNKWAVIIAISSFITIFMLIFQPFGLTEYQKANKIYICIGYGFVTFLILVFNLIFITSLFKKWFEFKNWTVLKQIIWLSWVIFTIGVGNYLYSSFLFNQFSGFFGFVLFQLFTLAVGIIPIIIVTIVNQNRQLLYYMKEANEFNNSVKRENYSISNERNVCIIADNEKDKLEIDISDLIYIESEGNYIKVFYTEKSKINYILLRSSLKRIEDQLIGLDSVVKCHRAFLVNIKHVLQVKGNSQGLRLALNFTEFEIPVSRNFSKELKEKINCR